MTPYFMRGLVSNYFDKCKSPCHFIINKPKLENIIYGRVGDIYRILYFIGNQYASQLQMDNMQLFSIGTFKVYLEVLDFVNYDDYVNRVIDYKSSNDNSRRLYDHLFIKGMCTGLKNHY